MAVQMAEEVERSRAVLSHVVAKQIFLFLLYQICLALRHFIENNFALQAEAWRQLQFLLVRNFLFPNDMVPFFHNMGIVRPPRDAEIRHHAFDRPNLQWREVAGNRPFAFTPRHVAVDGQPDFIAVPSSLQIVPHACLHWLAGRNARLRPSVDIDEKTETAVLFRLVDAKRKRPHAVDMPFGGDGRPAVADIQAVEFDTACETEAGLQSIQRVVVGRIATQRCHFQHLPPIRHDEFRRLLAFPQRTQPMGFLQTAVKAPFTRPVRCILPRQRNRDKQADHEPFHPNRIR